MKKLLLLSLSILLIVNVVNAQQPTCYRVYLHDKNNSTYSVHFPGDFLSDRAIEKRHRFGIPILVEDLPVNQSYIQSVLNINSNIKLLTKSKWMNTIVIYCPNDAYLQMITNLPFVDSILPVANYVFTRNFLNNSVASHPNVSNSVVHNKDYNYGNSIEQLALHNGQLLQQEGFYGENMLIAVLDAGWEGFDISPYFTDFYQHERLLGVRDLIPGENNVYYGHTHGTSVTSIMAATADGELIGTAPAANYFFIRTENPWSEQLIEEDFWAAGAELADSIGADVINSSLGYSTFPDFLQANYTVAQNDGVTSIASQCASIAADKGIIVVISAGNEGDSEWHRIARPADAVNALTVGAVDKDSIIASFSSVGFSADGRVKPDVCAVGLNTWVVYPNNGDGDFVERGNGTSFSGPVIAGLSACLWQALPHKTSSEVMQIIRENAHLYHSPDTAMGYGIPDFYQAYLNNKNTDTTSIFNYCSTAVLGYPNPCTDDFTIVNASFDIQNIEFFDMTGKKLFSHSADNSYYVTINVGLFPSGIYFAKIKRSRQIDTIKIIKK